MSLSFIIRDAVTADMAACLALDHSYSTDYVWQMSLQPDERGWQISFRSERLPRERTEVYAADEQRLRRALRPDRCGIVAVDKANEHIVGYLTMDPQPDYGYALIHDVVVERELRHQRVGSRLIGVARQWALERDVRHLLIQVRTKNYPGIQFIQSNGFAFCGFNDRYFPNHDIAVFFGQSLR